MLNFLHWKFLILIFYTHYLYTVVKDYIKAREGCNTIVVKA